MGVMEQGTDLRFLWRVSKWPHRNFFWGPKFNFGSVQWWYFPKRPDFHQMSQEQVNEVVERSTALLERYSTTKHLVKCLVNN
jgi:hypothetical protein